MEVAGRSALVTGATGGLGGAIAEVLRERGAHLTVTGRRTDALAPLAQRLNARAIAADLSDRRDVHRLATDAGEVEILVLNAALPASGELASFAEDEIDRAIDVNLRAPIMLTALIVAQMVARSAGHVVFVGSLGGKAASPRTAIYSSTKFGLRGFAHALREDLNGTGVGVSIVLPGPIRGTGMWADTGVQLPRGMATRSPTEVGLAVVAAIERNRAEVVVADLTARIGATIAAVAPGFTARLQRHTPAGRIMAAVAAAQRDKR